MFRILHLSDLHIRTNTTWSTDAILSDAKRIILEQANEENVDVVAFTGDIAFSGQEAEYAIASDWFDDLCLQTSGLNLDAKSVMFVPGNHDVDRKLIPKAASAIEDALGKSSEQSHIANYYLDSDSFQLLKRRHDAYFKFCHSFTGQDDLTKHAGHVFSSTAENAFALMALTAVGCVAEKTITKGYLSANHS